MLSLKCMRPDLLLFERLAGAGALDLDSPEQPSEREVYGPHCGSRFLHRHSNMTKYEEKHAQHQQQITHQMRVSGRQVGGNQATFAHF